MKLISLIIYAALFLFSPASIAAQSKFSLPACSSSKPQSYIGDRLILTLPKKVKFKHVQDNHYFQYFIGFGKKKDRIWFSGIFGPFGSSGQIPKEWLSASTEVSQRIWTFQDLEGVDVKGKLENGNYWRYFAIVGEEIKYYNVSSEAAAYFDSIIDTVCYQKRS